VAPAKVTFHPGASEDYAAAYSWYHDRYHQSLKALAIREKKIHIVGNSELKIEGTPVSGCRGATGP